MLSSFPASNPGSIRLSTLALCAAAALFTGCGGSPSNTATRSLVVTEEAFDFTSGDSLAQVATTPAAPTRVFALEQSGNLRVLDVSVTPVADVSTFSIGSFSPGGFPTAASGLVIDSSVRGGALAGFATSSGSGADGVIIFDVLSATVTATFDIGAMTITATGQQTSTGSADPVFQPSFATSPVVIGDTLFLATSNTSNFVDYFPGTVFAFALDPSNHSLFAAGAVTPTVIYTKGYNITGISAGRTLGGRDVVCVTTSGAGAGTSDVTDMRLEVIDASTLLTRAQFDFGGPTSAFAAPAMRPDGTEAVVGLAGFTTGTAQIVRASMLDVDSALTATGTAITNLSAGIENGLATPIVIPIADPLNPPASFFVSALRYDASGTHLFAVSFNDSTFNDLAAPRGLTPVVARQAHVKHGVTGSASGGPAADFFAIRAGTPGVDFQGADVMLGTINVPVAGSPGVTRAVLDEVRTY